MKASSLVKQMQRYGHVTIFWSVYPESRSVLWTYTGLRIFHCTGAFNKHITQRICNEKRFSDRRTSSFLKKWRVYLYINMKFSPFRYANGDIWPWSNFWSGWVESRRLARCYTFVTDVVRIVQCSLQQTEPVLNMYWKIFSKSYPSFISKKMEASVVAQKI